MKKRRYWILGGTGVFLAIVIAGAGLLLETRAGLNWAVRFAQSHSDGALRIGQAEGCLAGPFTLEQVRLDLSGATIRTDQVRIDWHPLALLLGKVSVTQLRGSGIHIQPAPGAGTSNAASTGLPDNIDLPVSVSIGQVRLRGITWKDSKRSLTLANLDFSLQASSRRIRIGKLDAQGPGVDIEGSLQARPQGNWPVNVDLISRLRPPGYPEISGRTRLHGALRGTLVLQQGLNSPFQSELKAQIDHLFGQARVEGTLHLATFDPHKIDKAWPQIETGAELAFSGSLSQFGVRGTINFGKRPARTVILSLSASLHERQLQMHHLNVALAGSPARLTLRGQLDTRAPYPAQLTLAWQSLQWPLNGNHPAAYAPAGSAQLAGTLDDWRLRLATLLGARGVPTGRWAMQAHGNRDSANVDALAGLWLGGTVSGQGQLDRRAKQPFRVKLRARNLQSVGLSSNIHGHAGFDLSASGHLAPLAANVNLTALQGRLNGQPLKGGTALAYAGSALDLESLDVAVGSNRLQATGHWDKRLSLDWQLEAPQLGTIDPRLAGDLKGHGRISGTIDAPHVAVAVQASQLHWRSLGIGQARVQGSLDLAGRENASLTVKLQAVGMNSLVISQLDANLDGPADAQRISLAVLSNRGDVALTGKGRMSPDGWNGQITSGELHPLRHASFTLDAPAGLRLTAQEITLERNCWHDTQHAGFCAAFQRSRPGWQARLDLQSLPLALANPYLENSVSMAGTVKGTVHAERSPQGLAMTGELHVGAGSLTRAVGGKPQRLEFSEAGIEAGLDHDLARLRLGLVLKDGGLLDAVLDVPWRENKTPAGHLKLKASLPDLSGLGALTPYVSHVGGRLFADLDVSGSFQSPRFRGRLQLTRLQARLPRYGTRFEQGSLLLEGKGNALSLQGEARDPNKGRLAVDGILKHGNTWQLSAHVRGERFRAANMPEAHVLVSPDLTVSVNGRAISLTGSITVPQAHIRPPHFSGAITPTPDLVIVGENATPSPKWTLSAHLHIKLGQQVQFTGYGLSGRIGGELELQDSPGRLTTGSGELKILDGQYKAYGQDLTIEHGRLLFSGGTVTNPGLDMRAIRKVGTVTAGLQVTGTLRNPKLQVFSDPPMTQSNALAYLLFGHGMEQTSGSEQSTLNQAANAIGIAGGTLLAKTLGEQVGVDTVSVESASPYSANANQASLFLGKYLSPRLYVSYGIGLYAPINLLRIRYTLSRHWALEAESGTISGADILYVIGQ